MRIATIAVIGALILAAPAAEILTLPAAAAEFGTREEAIAMVKRVQAKVKKDGLEATFKAINAGAKEFKDRDLYAFMLDFDGNDPANAGVPAVVGKNIMDLRDQDGKFLTKGLLAVAKSPAGSGWYDYRWPNPATKTIEDKSTYVERVGENHIVGVGIYKNEQANVNTVGVISGSPNSDDTYLRIAYDLAEVLNDGENLRVMPIAGIGGPRNIRDVKYVKGIEVGLTQTSILNSFRRSNERMGQSEDKLFYIAKLFNEEVHLVARNGITSIEQLKGLKVNLDVRGSGTSYTMRDVFKTLDIEVEEVSLSQAEAFEKVKSGEIAATVLIAGKPVQSVSRLTRADGLHFVPIPFSQPLIADYLPSALTSDDYPALVPAGQSVETIAVGAALITYGWPNAAAERTLRVETFVESFFSKIDDFKKPSHHPKWREVNIAATLPGWERFGPAQAWLDRQRGMAAGPNGRRTPTAAAPRPEAAPPFDIGQAELYQDFLRWRQQQKKTGQPAQ